MAFVVNATLRGKIDLKVANSIHFGARGLLAAIEGGETESRLQYLESRLSELLDGKKSRR